MKKDEAGCLGMQSTELDFNHSTIAKGLCLAFIYLFIFFYYSAGSNKPALGSLLYGAKFFILK